MVVVDGVTGWLGGLNVGDEYLGLDPEFSPFRDTHIKLEGPVVTQLQSVCLWDWYWAAREIPELDWKPTAARGGDVAAMIVPSDPIQRMETASLFFITAINAASERVWLTAPYFVPDEAVQKALELAALRGVDVRILTSGKSDSLPVFLAGFHYIQILSEYGIKFYAYEPGFMHEKVMLVDDEVSTVGTVNFDNRSFRLNFEVTALIVDKKFAAEVESMLNDDFAHSRRIDNASLSDKPYWWQVGVKLSRLAAPIL
jgi:cardiolipin synthase